jgi:hypothetical protein
LVKIALRFFQIIYLRPPPPLFPFWGIYSVAPFGTLFAYAPVSGAQKVRQPSGPGHFPFAYRDISGSIRHKERRYSL